MLNCEDISVHHLHMLLRCLESDDHNGSSVGAEHIFLVCFIDA